MERRKRVPESTLEQGPYQYKDAVSLALKGTMITGLAGTTLAAVQNALTKQNVGPWALFTRTGGVISVFAATGGAYEFTKAASANLREKDDSWNHAIGGFVGGAVLGLRLRTIPAVLGYGASAAILLGVFDYTGGALTGYYVDPNEDLVEKREQLRKNKRRPIQETIDELGEGRGIYAPGYLERRRMRIREKYGIDVPVSRPASRPTEN